MDSRKIWGGLGLRGVLRVAGAGVLAVYLAAGAVTIDMSATTSPCNEVSANINCNLNPIVIYSGTHTVRGSSSTRSIEINDTSTAGSSSINLTLEGPTLASVAVKKGNNVTISVSATSTLNSGLALSGGVKVTVKPASTANYFGLTVGGNGITGAAVDTLIIQDNYVVTATTLASALTVQSGSPSGGLIIAGTGGKAVGSVSIPANQVIGSGQTLTVMPSAVLTIGSGRTLTNNGTLIVSASSANGNDSGSVIVYNGKFISAGTTTINGGIKNNDTISITGGTFRVAATGILDNRNTSTGIITGTVTVNNGGIFLKRDQTTSPAFGIASTHATKAYGDTTFKLTTVGGYATGQVTFELISGQDVISIKDSTVTILKTGEAEIRATMAGNNQYNHVETGTPHFKITVNPRPISHDSVTFNIGGTYTYNGDRQCPAAANVTASVFGKPMAATEYTIACNVNDNMNAGEATVTFTAVAGGNFTGSVNKKFTISPLAVGSNATVTFSGGSSKTYDGAPAVITPVVTGTGTGMLSGTFTSADYDIRYYRSGDTTSDITNAGTIAVTAVFKGNYAGSRSANYNINRRTLRLNASETVIPVKEYDGNRSIDTSRIQIKFDTLVSGQSLSNVLDYGITNAQYNPNANAGDKTAEFRVTLVANGPVARNYSLSSGGFSGGTGGEITKKTPTDSVFRFTIPTNHRYTGVAQGFDVTSNLGTGLTGLGKFTVLYNGQEKNSSASSPHPAEIASYTVTLDVEEGTNYNGALITIGTYNIDPPLPPDIESYSADTTLRINNTLRLNVAAKPVGATNAALSYRWYRDGVALSGATGATYSVEVRAPDFEAGETYQYSVRVYNSISVSGANGTGTQRDSVEVGPISVTVREAAKSISSAIVSVQGQYEYDGLPIAPHNSDITVTLGGATLAHGTEYSLSFSNNTDAGLATVTVSGVDEYTGTATATFAIEKRELSPSELVSVSSVVYNGLPQPIELRSTSPSRTGIGAVTALYNGSANIPVNVGEYEVIVTAIAEGKNYKAYTPDDPIEFGMYVITKKTPVLADLDFDIPEDLRANGEPQGIGPVTLPGDGYGSLTVTYDNSEDLPVDPGTYVVRVVIEGGDNYDAATILLGNFELVDPTSVYEGEREVSATENGGSAAMVPVSALAAKFTAGPNPVAGSSGTVNFYRSGGRISGGTLTVYDAAGNVVNRIAVSDNGAAVGHSGNRVIGSWNLRDASGRAVAAGTYLVRGNLKTAAGKTEKVSIPVGVR